MSSLITTIGGVAGLVLLLILAIAWLILPIILVSRITLLLQELRQVNTQLDLIRYEQLKSAKTNAQ